MTSSTIFSGVSPISLPAAATGGNSPLTLRDMLFFIRMRWLWIAATTFAFLVLAGSYVLTAEPTFVANTQLVIFPQVSGSEAQRAFAEDAFIEGQLEIAKSSDVVGGTVTTLGLDTDPDFVDQTPSLQDRAKNWLMGASSEPDTASQEAAGPGPRDTQPQQQIEDGRIHDRAVATLLNMMGVRRIGSSTIIEISAAASTPQQAVDIADTLARQYIQKNIAMKANASRQYSEWLTRFVSEQQRGLAEAASALASFTSNPRDQFKLAELQSATDARRTLYENTLNQLTEAKQRITYPVSDATIVSRATLPLSKARPRSTLIIAFATACDKRSYSHKLWRVARGSNILRRLKDQADFGRIILLHEKMASFLVGAGYRPERLTTIRNPVAPLSIKRIEAEANEEFVFIGRLDEEKGIEDAVAATRKAGVRLCVIGDGPLMPLVAASGDHVRAVGWQSHTEIGPTIRKARALLMPSRYPEPFGLVAIEAARSGLPVIMSRSAFLAEEMQRAGMAIACDTADESAFADTLTRFGQMPRHEVRAMSERAFLKSPDLASTHEEWRDALLSEYHSLISTNAVPELTDGVAIQGVLS
ncbi:glycosyltransferase [Rhizobium johnstonii]